MEYSCLKKYIFILLFLMQLISIAQQNKVSSDSLELYLNKAYDYNTEADFVKSVQLGRKLLEKAYQQNDSTFIAEAYYLLGFNDETVQDYDGAKEKYLKALEIAEHLKNSDLIIDIYNELGNLYSQNDKKFEESEKYYLKALELSKKLQRPTIYFYINLSWNYLERNLISKASNYIPYLRDYLEQEILDLSEDNNIINKANIYFVLGWYEGEIGNTKLGLNYLDKAIEITTKNKLYEEASEAYKQKAQLLKANGEEEQAYDSLEKHVEYYTKLLNKKTLEKLQSEQVKYEVNEYERALANSQKEEELAKSAAASKNKLNILFIVLCCILIISMVIIYKAYQNKKQLNKNLNESNEELIKAKKEAEIAAEVKASFISNISHELRTPLHGVVGITSLLLAEKNISESNKELLRSLKFSGDYLLGLISNVLLMSKIDNKKIKVKPEATNLNRLLENIKSSVKFSADQNQVMVDFAIDKNVPSKVILDGKMVSEILINLVENATKFAKGGHVNVMIKKVVSEEHIENLMLRFVVEDDGIGIPENKKELIFQKFSQVVVSKNGMDGGSGIGLSIVKSLLLQLGSNIHIESEEGKGSTFYFDLQAKIPSKKDGIVIQSDQMIDIYSDKKILLVEDNAINKMVIEKFLYPYNFKVDTVTDGKEGFKVIQEKKYDLVLLDINIPSMNGYELARRSRELGIKTPIIAVTASELSEIKDDVYAAGMDDILIKPFQKEKLIKKISKQLR